MTIPKRNKRRITDKEQRRRLRALRRVLEDELSNADNTSDASKLGSEIAQINLKLDGYIELHDRRK